MKYLKLFEAFESETLSDVLKFINPSDRNDFKDLLSKYCKVLDFPMSKLSEDLFQYLYFDDALELLANSEDEPCDNDYVSGGRDAMITGEKCAGPTGENKGTILRNWGRGKRRVVCPVCNGSGIKPKTNPPIKWVKFWFDKDGKYIVTTATDGLQRNTTEASGTLDPNLDNYNIVERGLRYSDLDNYDSTLENPYYFLFAAADSSARNGRMPRVAQLYRQKGGNKTYNFMLQYVSDGSTPDGIEWKNVAPKSWVVSTGGDIMGDISRLELKSKPKNLKTEVDFYNFNSPLKVSTSSGFRVGTPGNLKETLKSASFALVLDLVGLKNKLGDTPKLGEIKSKREESRKGATALMTNDEIRNANFKSYLDTLNRNAKIKMQNLISTSGKVELDDQFLKSLFLRSFGYNLAGFFVLQSLSASSFYSLYESLVTGILEKNDRIVGNAAEKLERLMRQSEEYTKNMRNNIRALLENPDEGRKKLVYKLIEVNDAIVKKISNTQVTTIAQMEVLYTKLRSIKNIYSNSPLLVTARNADRILSTIEEGSPSSCTRALRNISDFYFEPEDNPTIVENFDELIKFIQDI